MEDLNVVESDVPWTKFERSLKLFRQIQCDDSQRLGSCIEDRFRDSSLGSFLHHLNSVQLQQVHVQRNKLCRLRFDIDHKFENQWKLERQNDICENLVDLIDELLQNNSSGKITIESTLKKLKVLRLTGSKINSLDGSLQSLADLRVLVLAGNCLNTLQGQLLPRSLLALELFCNQLTSLDQLMQCCPPHLLYLGLARNYLTQGNLESLQCARYLYHLDLSHNNIEDLPSIIGQCLKLINLSSLLLVGNPCSMAASYANYVTCKLPRLIFLDGEIVKMSCENVEEDTRTYDFSGTLQIFIFRIMGLPQPPVQKVNNKKVIHTFRVEMDCSLLKQYVPQREELFTENKIFDNADLPLKNDTAEKKKPRTPKRSKTEEQLKNSKRKSTSDRDRKKPSKLLDLNENTKDFNEIETYTKNIKASHPDSKFCFVSEAKPWGKIIDFNNAAIEVVNCDLTVLRDVLKTKITVYIIHLKTLPPLIKNKPEKQSKLKTIDYAESEEVDKDLNKHVLVSKTVVAKFKIPLQDILWNIKSLDYVWSQNNPLTVELSQGLQGLNYVAKKKPSKYMSKVPVTDSSLPQKFIFPLKLKKLNSIAIVEKTSNHKEWGKT